MEYTTCEKGRYYDLIRIPRKRTWDTFHCPVCGLPSFFKVFDQCRVCEWEIDDYETWRAIEQRYQKRIKREKWRRRWKTLECALLPLLILFGKAWYLRSDRIHWSDPYPPEAQQRELSMFLTKADQND